MVFRLLILVLTFAIPLSAVQTNNTASKSDPLIGKEKGCQGCGTCRERASTADLLQDIHVILNNGLLSVPQLQPQLIALVQQIVTEGGIGIVGAQGPAGPAGATGATGAAGPAGAGISDYLYVYNLIAQVVALEADITFDTNGLITPGFTHAPGTAAINIIAAGVYKVDFSVSGVEPNQFTLFLNGGAVAGTTYGSGAGTQQNTGQAIIAMSAGDVLTLRNHTSAAAVTLQTLAGGTVVNANASISILRLSP